MSDWKDIASAPMDGTVFEGCSLDPSRLWPARRMMWGIAVRPDEGYVCNGGSPWWINEDGRHLAPTPTHWRAVRSEVAREEVERIKSDGD